MVSVCSMVNKLICTWNIRSLLLFILLDWQPSKYIDTYIQESTDLSDSRCAIYKTWPRNPAMLLDSLLHWYTSSCFIDGKSFSASGLLGCRIYRSLLAKSSAILISSWVSGLSWQIRTKSSAHALAIKSIFPKLNPAFFSSLRSRGLTVELVLISAYNAILSYSLPNSEC